MEYATNLTDDVPNTQFLKHSGYYENEGTKILFSPKNIHKISCKITELLMGVDKHNRPIIVPNETIHSVMSNVYSNFRPETSDIFSRYNIPQQGTQSYVQKIIDQVINIITTDVKTNLGMIEANEKLSVWTTVLGDFNEHGLRSHPTIKLREKRPMPMAFNMNY